MNRGFAGFTGEQIDAMVKCHPLAELRRREAQYLDEWNRSASPEARAVAILELQLVQHLICQHGSHGFHERSAAPGASPRTPVPVAALGRPAPLGVSTR